MIEETDWDKAGQLAAEQIGFDCDEPCWDAFTIEVGGHEFNAELVALHGRGVGTVQVTYDQGCRIYDEDGEEVDILS